MRPYNMHTLTNINMQSIERNVMACRYKIQSRNLPNLVVIQHVEYPEYILDKQFSLILHFSEMIIRWLIYLKLLVLLYSEGPHMGEVPRISII